MNSPLPYKNQHMTKPYTGPRIFMDSLARPKCRWEDNIKMGFQEIGLEV